jgi:hypothetical protein
MAAIVTDSFRRNNAKFFMQDIASNSTNYYVGLGKSNKWTLDEESMQPGDIPVSLGIEGENTEIKSNLVTLLKINNTNAERVIPHIKWKAGARYKAYSPYDPDCFYPGVLEGGIEINPCYAVISGRIYLCLQAGQKGTAGIPVATDYRATTVGGDGYVWILIDNISTALSKLLTDQFINITSGIATAAIAPTIEADGGGLLYGFSVLSGGDGYGSLNEVTFVARYSTGTTADIDCPVIVDPDTGVLKSVLLPPNWSYTDIASKRIVDGYFKIDSTGSGAVIVPHIAPLRGFAYEPTIILPSWFVGIAVDAADDISSDGFYIPYRQISVIKDVQYTEGASPDTLGAARYLTLNSAPNSGISIGDMLTITSGSTQVKAFADTYKAINIGGTIFHRLYFHQNSITGYGVIPNSGTVTDSKGTSVTYSSVNNSEYIPRTGTVIFTENRKPINRQSGQTEEIKIIIQF